MPPKPKPKTETVTCTDCGGRGIISFGAQDLKCAACDGTGTVKADASKSST
jgi:DnaJ-class molecular chaperone